MESPRVSPQTEGRPSEQGTSRPADQVGLAFGAPEAGSASGPAGACNAVPASDASAQAPGADGPMPVAGTSASVAGAPALAELDSTGRPKRYSVRHSYIWLGSLRAFGVVVAAIVVSSFSSLVGLLFEDAGTAGGLGLFVAGIAVVAIIVAIAAACFVFQWWSYRHLWYELGDEEFSFYSGIFNKKRVHIPYQRVQSVDQRASLLQRIFGVCSVHIDTAGGSSHTAVTVPYLRKSQAEHLRMQLYARKAAVLGLNPDTRVYAQAPGPSASWAPGVAAAAAAAEPAATASAGAAAMPAGAAAPVSAAAAPAACATGNVLDFGAEAWDDVRGVFAGQEVYMGRVSYEHGLTNKELLLAAITNNASFALIVLGALLTVFQVVGGVLDVAGGRAEAVAGTALSFGRSVFGDSLVVLGVVAGLVVLAVLWLVSVGSACLSFGGFRARRRGRRIEVEQGLLQHRISSVDIDRVQSVIVKQGVIRRLLGYCEVSLGKIEAASQSADDQQQRTAQSGIVVHPLVKLDRVPEILAGLVPEFADIPASTTPVARVALRRAVIRRAVLFGAGFWLAVITAAVQVAANLALGSAPDAQPVLFYVNAGACALYAVCAIVFALEVAGAVLWARGSGFAYNRRFMQVANGGLSRETVSFPRRKIQFGFTKTNPFQRRARTATISVRTAAGTGGTTVSLIDVCEEDAAAWLDWVRPHANVVR